MIGYLRGILVEKTPDSLIIDVGGVGYEVQVPASSFCVLPPGGEQASLFILTKMSQEELRLFGFASLFDRKVFQLLLTVKDVGPRVALKLMSAHTGDELCQAITSGRAETLTKIPGVGAKTADRLLLELKEKCQKLYARRGEYGDLPVQGTASIAEPVKISKAKSAASAEVSARHRFLEDLTSALSNLGYKEKQIADVLRTYEERLRSGVAVSLEAALRETLKNFAGHLVSP